MERRSAKTFSTVNLGKLKSLPCYIILLMPHSSHLVLSHIQEWWIWQNAYCSVLRVKSCLAHIKPMTVLTLELLAAVLAIQWDLKSELEVTLHQSVFWTEFTTVLQYIENESTSFHTFVSNCLTVIHQHSQPSQWRYTNSEFNPADDASRGLTVDSIVAFLSTIVSPWPGCSKAA